MFLSVGVSVTLTEIDTHRNVRVTQRYMSLSMCLFVSYTHRYAHRETHTVPVHQEASSKQPLRVRTFLKVYMELGS
jgi:hypothetical protein